jgi:hypothetical protein
MRSRSASASVPGGKTAGSRGARPGPALLLLLACAAASATARAAPEGEWEVAGAAGGAHLRVDRRWAPGWQLGAEAQRGLSELWSLRLALSGSWHPVSADTGRPGGRVQALMASVGGVYALDMFRVVPFGELTISALDLSQAVRAADRYIGVEAGLGVTYHLDPRWSLSGVLRGAHFTIPLDGGDRLDPAPLMLGLTIRLCRQL